MTVKIHQVTIQYLVERTVDIIHDEPQTDEQLKETAIREDTEPKEGLTAPTLAIRRLLKNSTITNVSIKEINMERDEPNAKS